ncbi:MAG: ion transporter [Pseudomonadota bacterium]
MVSQQVASQIGVRHKLYSQLEPDARVRPGLSFTNFIIVMLVLASFVALAIETEPTISDGWREGLKIFNLAILLIFALEYLMRLWVEGEDPRYRGFLGRIRFIFTPYAVADLIAFLPELLWIIFMSATGNEEGLMMLRVLRLARLIKIARFVPAVDVFVQTVKRSGAQLLTTLALASSLVYVAAVMLYFIEGVGEGREAFASIPRAIWWAIATLTTVGYGDVYPITAAGKVAASVIALAGIGVVALPAGVFASAFADELREREAERVRLRMLEAETDLNQPSNDQEPQRPA